MTMTDERPAADYDAARRAMIDSQLRTSGVNEPWVLAAMANAPREDFVPEASRAAAYSDRAVPLGGGRFLAAPLFYGRLLGEAQPSPGERALVIGGGSDYLAALIGPLVGSLEAVAADRAAKLAMPDAYTLILVDGAVEELPEGIVRALAEDGRIVGGLIDRGVSRLAIGRKAAGAIAWLPLAEMGIPALPEFAAPRRWSF
jgi:protein-L-isoaspartate(D-aspartate) O-methyltransferase